jgi:hypothetical protein
MTNTSSIACKIRVRELEAIVGLLIVVLAPKGHQTKNMQIFFPQFRNVEQTSTQTS